MPGGPSSQDKDTEGHDSQAPWRGVCLGYLHESSPTEGAARNQRIESISPQMLPAPFTQ